MNKAKTVDEITSEEWIKYHWVEVTEFGDDERWFVCTGLNTPEEKLRMMQIHRDIEKEEKRKIGEIFDRFSYL